MPLNATKNKKNLKYSFNSTMGILTFGLMVILLLSPITTYAQYGSAPTPTPQQPTPTPAPTPQSSLVANGPQSGSIDINSSSDLVTVTRPLQGLNRFVLDMNRTIPEGTMRFRVVPVSDFGELPVGVNPVIAYRIELINFTYNDATFTFDIEVNSTLRNVRVFTRNSPAIERAVQQVGPSTTNPGFTIYRIQTSIIPQNILVTGDTATIRTGGSIIQPMVVGLVSTAVFFIFVLASSMRNLKPVVATKYLR